MTSLRPPPLHQPTLHPRLDSMDLTEATWRGRAIRYVAIYLALALLLVGARSLTRDIRPELRVAQDQEAKLLIQRNDLAVAVQTLENPQRIRDWAFANGMVRFAEAAPKESQAILPLPPPGQGDAPVSPAQSQNAQPRNAQPRNAQSQETQPDNAVSDNAVPNNNVEVRTLWR